MNNWEQHISRVKRSKQDARFSYNKMSAFYDVIAGFSEKKFTQMGLKKLSVKPDEIVLEIGYGTGKTIVQLAKSIDKSGKVYGIDISDGMYDVTSKLVRKNNLSSNVNLLRGDAGSLPYSDNFFDKIFMSFTLELFDTPEIPKVLHESKRVLREKGWLCVVSLSKKTPENMITKLYEITHSLFPKFVDCRPIVAHQIINNSGFKIIDATTSSMWGIAVDIILAEK
jgi:ubiquinone/menaquinone biosynthesis C-methylase UbiE